jgi:glycosyltransferase involved in cell wall biosynthesis
MRPAHDLAGPHLLLVSYLFPPSSRSGARRTAALRDALEDLDVRTTVLTSTVSGRLPDDNARSVVRARDARSLEGLQRIVGSDRRRWWSRLIVPDATTLSWAPAAAAAAAQILKRARPDVVFTSSPPESVHLLGLSLRARGIPWVADLRDGWTFESPTLRPYLTGLDRRLERLVVARADAVTTVTEHLAADLQARYGNRRIVHLTNGFDPTCIARSSDERAVLDPARFSIVHTGTLNANGKDPQPFLRALARLLADRPELTAMLEVVFVGPLTPDEEKAMHEALPTGVVKILGEVPYERALGLQQAADGLLLVTPPRSERDVLTAKVHEYLAAGKPILALADGTSAAALLGAQHTLAPPDDEERILAALRDYVGRWAVRRETFRSDLTLEPIAYPQIAHRLADLFAEIGAYERIAA